MKWVTCSKLTSFLKKLELYSFYSGVLANGRKSFLETSPPPFLPPWATASSDWFNHLDSPFWTFLFVHCKERGCVYRSIVFICLSLQLNKLTWIILKTWVKCNCGQLSHLFLNLELHYLFFSSVVVSYQTVSSTKWSRLGIADSSLRHGNCVKLELETLTCRIYPDDWEYKVVFHDLFIKCCTKM